MQEEAIRNFFSPDGPLSQSLDRYEERPAQAQMAQVVFDTLKKGTLSIIEAGTGIGKTLAYLVPALILGKKIVVSTATKNLQDQILEKDLPFLKKRFFPQIKYTVLKGRQNYLCKRQLLHLNLQGGLNSPEDVSLLKRVMSWARKTSSGDLTEIGETNSHPLLSSLVAIPERCHGRNCQFFHSCYVIEARNRASGADLIVVNHHLLCTDLILKQQDLGDIIPDVDAVIIDEAHHFPEVLRQVFGLHYSFWNWKRLSSELRLLAAEAIDEDLLDRQVSRIDALHQKIISALLQSGPVHPDDSSKSIKRRNLEALFSRNAEISTYFQELIDRYEDFQSIFGGTEEENFLHLKERISEYGSVIRQICTLDHEDHVYWAEWDRSSFAIRSMPITAERAFQSVFCLHYPCVVMTSATLATAKNGNESFDFFLESLGLPASTPCYKFASPYEYDRQMVIYVPPSSFPLPGDPNFTDAVADIACEVLRISSGRALFLFTNYRNMEVVGTILRQRLDYPILIQGEKSRGELLAEFRENISSILLATRSFWEGIDVPGESLTLLLIDKLPFATPEDPVIQGESFYYGKKGKNYFMDFQVPRTVLVLRQGIGRLIRSSRDTGMVAIFDVRLRTSSYGRIFLESLPPCPVVDSLDSLKKQWETIKRGDWGRS
ncbi:ATP-dependent DNA helicase [Thermodesulforhabdus norvegica]|uniref:DNA 5'-3' helicase n=1 Tax=Thermodesulforhabdus norvegica TaxID=39841 RepID=A0A1I4ST53_9BACT|nr:ATP-dependent DNA helicase [Thermodesulforhabdus norvegica]SFM67520.1 ATP-dependent DNA helicase DinG [Thermodesulforhabdus norvegica]